MSELQEYVPSPTEAERYTTGDAAFFLDFYTQKLVEQARNDHYDFQLRNGFLVAVGTNALRSGFLDAGTVCRSIGWSAIGDHHGYATINSQEPAMAEWTAEDWVHAVRQAVSEAVYRPEYAKPVHEEFGDYLVLLNDIGYKRAKFVRLGKN